MAGSRGTRAPVRGRGFTLIEILVVIGIIMVLVTIVVAVSSNVKLKAQTERTRQVLKKLDGALDEYRDATGGTMPTPDGSGSMAPFITAVTGMNMQSRLEGLGQEVYQGNDVVDGFGKSIRYYAGTPTSGGKPYFQSYGPDAAANTADDMYSYEK